MEIFIFDTSFQLIKIIDDYESFIWTERYSDYGDFELHLAADSDVIQYLRTDCYVEIRESNRTMIIEDIQIETDVDDGPSLKISGRSLESILDRRIIWKQTSISNKAIDEVIKQLLDENIMSGAGEERCIDLFTYVDLPDDHVIRTNDAYKINQIQFTGDNLFDVVKSICDAFGIGFRVLLKDKKMQFELFVGENRSYENDDGTDQYTNPHVVFSPTFSNLLNSSYLESNKTLKTVTLVAGSGEGSDRKTVEVSADDDYVQLTSEPYDWSKNYASYFVKTGTTYYESVDGADSAPPFEHGKYYYNWYAANGYSGKKWYLLLKEPDDWLINYGDFNKYAVHDADSGKQVQVNPIKVAPLWSAGTYYRHVSTNKGIYRRELYTDARDLTNEVQKQNEDGTVSTETLDDEEYNKMLDERGKEKLAECKVIKSFEGSIEPNTEYKYGSIEDVKIGKADYSIGDVVQVENEYGMGSRCRVTEFIRSADSSGSETYPTFTII